MVNDKLYTLVMFGCPATILNGKLEVSITNEDQGSKIVSKVANFILDGKLKSLRLNLPNKIVFITAKGKESLLFKAEEANDKGIMN